MSGAQPPVGATSGSSSAAVPSLQQQQQQQQEMITSSAAMITSSAAVVPSLLQQQQEMITVVSQLSDATNRELIKQQQEITAAHLYDAIQEFIRQQQQQHEITAARSRSDELRGWMMFVVTLTAGVTYSAALNPPGGVWQADDPTGGYIAGRPVLLYKFRSQYLIFFYLNAASFLSSLFIIVLLSTTSFYNRIPRSAFSTFVALDIFAWAGAFILASSTMNSSRESLVYEVAMLGVLACIACHI